MGGRQRRNAAAQAIPRYGPHEYDLRVAIQASQAWREKLREESVGDLMRGYYQGRNPHPYDAKCTIDQWEDFE